MTWTEVAGFASGAVCVWLVVRRNIWNFPVGIANNVFFIVLFTQAGLYADAGLQVVYIGLGLLGWYWWLRGGIQRTALEVRRTPVWAWPAAGAFVGAGTWLFHWLLTTHTNSTVAGWDALTTMLSLAAQIMLNRKWLGNWVVWIAADVIYIALYASKGLWLTSVLYAVFLALCVIGLRQWHRSTQVDAPGSSSSPALGEAIGAVAGGPPR
jgi:nicotinamide mononucleotide transporter